jgi:hypothetical protein
MIDGFEYWTREGFAVESGAAEWLNTRAWSRFSCPA